MWGFGANKGFIRLWGLGLFAGVRVQGFRPPKAFLVGVLGSGVAGLGLRVEGLGFRV